MSTGSKKRLNATSKYITHNLFSLVKEVWFVLLGNEPVLGRASFHFSLYFVFFRGAVLVLFRLLFVYCPPRGKDSDTTAAVDKLGNT